MQLQFKQIRYNIMVGCAGATGFQCPGVRAAHTNDGEDTMYFIIHDPI